MRRKFDVEAYMDACEDGEEILAFCKANHIKSYATLMDSRDSFPQAKRELWFKRLCSNGFIRFLAAHGIK